MSLLSHPASPFNIVDFANDLLSRPVEYVARPSGHPDESQAEFLAWQETDRACTLADDSLRNDLDAARKHILSICPGAVNISLSQTRKLTQFAGCGIDFCTEYMVFVTPRKDHDGFASFSPTLEGALADIASKLLAL